MVQSAKYLNPIFDNKISMGRITSLILTIAILSQVALCFQSESTPQLQHPSYPSVHPFHPLDPLSAVEIQTTSQIIRTLFRNVPQLVFSTITLKEPLKVELISSFLEDVPPPQTIPRKAFSIVIDPIAEIVYEVVVDLNRKVVESLVKVPQGFQPMFSFDETDDIQPTVLGSPLVHARAAQLGLNISNLIASFWDFGYAGDRPEYLGRRISQVFLYARNYPGDNFNAHPLGFIVIVDILKKRVLEIEELPIHTGFDTTNRQGEFASMTPQNYDPTRLPASFFRKDVSPINFVQPSGASYKITGNLIAWQNFKLRVGFNGREGLVLHHINYNDNGNIRPLIYRAALSELFVPYGDARPPFHRKMAFDVGQYGVGSAVHELQSPADCKGTVTFFDVVVSNKAGNPVTINQAVCVFEEDVGNILKKYDSGTGRAYAVRSQRLVIEFTATLGNYDYTFRWMFYQDASIKVEAQLNGIDHPHFVTSGSTPTHGTILSPNIVAPNHQHFMVMRVDTDIDGVVNTAVTTDVVPEGATGSSTNPYGNGFVAIETILRTTALARTNANPMTARTWSIYGDPNKRNLHSGTPMGYKLIAENPTHLMMNVDSPLHPKCAFVDYNVWITPYHDDHIYAGGLYLNNSGLPEWVGRNPDANVENTDIVLWHVMGLTHIPRVEDFPVMSSEVVGFWLKPVNFFTANPALNVPSFLNIP